VSYLPNVLTARLDLRHANQSVHWDEVEADDLARLWRGNFYSKPPGW
jgi:hypothetical protein